MPKPKRRPTWTIRASSRSYEVGEHEGQHFFSMEFVEGGSLAKKVSEGQCRRARRPDW